jgi:hypothetical protein
MIDRTNPLVAYGHHLISLLIVSLLLYYALQLYTGNVTFSIITTLGWLILPSTQAISEFLSTRNYMEGLGFSLAAIVFLHPFAQSGQFRWRQFALTLFFLICAMFSKEFFVTATFAFVFLAYFHRKFKAGLAACIAIAVMYSAYRIYFIGINFNYAIELLGFADYMKYLARLAFMFAAGTAGYGITIILLGAIIYSAVKKRISMESFILFIIILAVSLMTIYPTAGHLKIAYNHFGTWYRNPFIFNTILWVFGIYAVWQMFDKPKTRTIALAVIFISILPGSWRMRQSFDRLKAHYAAEGKFLIDNSKDKLLYSTVPAWWYPGGLLSLFKGRETASFILDKEFNDGVRPIIRPVDSDIKKIKTIWRYNGSRIAEEKFTFNRK